MSMTSKVRDNSLYSMHTKHKYNVYSRSIGNCKKHFYASKLFLVYLLIVLSGTVDNACRASKDIDNNANTRYEN